REAAAKRTAHADRIMRDMAYDHAEQSAKRVIDHGLVKCRVAHTSTDRQRFTVTRHFVEPGDLVDVHEMRRLRQAKRHDGNEALTPRQYAAVLRRDLGQNLERLIERLRHVTDEGRRLHAANLPAGPGLIICIQTINSGPGLSNPLPRGPYSKALPQHFHSNRQIPILIVQYRAA